MGGNTAQTMTTPHVDGVHEWDTQPKSVPNLPNVSYAMVPDILNHTVTSPISTTEMEESAAYWMITLALPTPPAMPMLGPLDSRKDINWGVMS